MKIIKLIFLGKQPADPGRLLLRLDDIGVKAQIEIYNRIKKDTGIAEYCLRIPENKITPELKEIINDNAKFIIWRSSHGANKTIQKKL